VPHGAAGLFFATTELRNCGTPQFIKSAAWITATAFNGTARGGRREKGFVVTAKKRDLL
jgi:hypothetical protein